MADSLHKLGTLAYRDTGAPPDSTDYTTVVVLHGFGWSGGVFERLVPLAPSHNVRLVLVNRRDFPGATAYSPAERAALGAAVADAPALRGFMRERARELHAFLVRFVAQEDVPPADSARGGIVLVAWSFGAVFLAALLSNIRAFPVNDVELQAYVRRVVFYDPPCHSLGYALPEDKYHPLADETIPPAERPIAFSKWVSGYYTHGDSPELLERRTPVDEPKPTILNMTPEEIHTHFVMEPTLVGGSDLLILNGGIETGANAETWKDALYLREPEVASNGDDDGDEEVAGEDWADVEVRYLWCDRSVYEMPWGTWALRKELEDAKQKGLRTRKLSVARLAGANHFAHWDQPERLLRALLAEETESL